MDLESVLSLFCALGLVRMHWMSQGGLKLGQQEVPAAPVSDTDRRPMQPPMSDTTMTEVWAVGIAENICFWAP